MKSFQKLLSSFKVITLRDTLFSKHGNYTGDAFTYLLQKNWRINHINIRPGQDISSESSFYTTFFWMESFNPYCCIPLNSPVSGIVNNVFIKKGDRVLLDTPLCSIEVD